MFRSEKSKRSAQRELHYGDSPRSGSRTQAYERVFEKEGSLTRDIQYSTTSEGNLFAVTLEETLK